LGKIAWENTRQNTDNRKTGRKGAGLRERGGEVNSWEVLGIIKKFCACNQNRKEVVRRRKVTKVPVLVWGSVFPGSVGLGKNARES